MMYTDKPKYFDSKFEVVSCFVEYNGEILLLHRQDHKPEGNTWGVPAGKVEQGEELLAAMVREIKQETGLEISQVQISYFGKVYVRYPSFDFVYHTYSTKLGQQQKVKLNHAEHKGFKWISPKKALDMLLIQDLDNCIKLFYNI